MSADALVAWLRQQLDVDERLLVDGGGCNCEDGVQRPDCADRLTREVEAKRRILDWYEAVSWSLVGVEYGEPGSGAVDDLPDLLRLLALPFVDRPGYRAEEWKPDGAAEHDAAVLGERDDPEDGR